MISNFERDIGMTYLEAKEYLIRMNKWKNVSDSDGYSIVTYAVELRNTNILNKPALPFKNK